MNTPRDARGQFGRICPDCNGQGLMNPQTACRACDGTGVASGKARSMTEASDELPAEATIRARRAFPVAAPHALKAALKAAAPTIAAAERERCVALIRAEAAQIRDGTAPLSQTIAIVLDDVADAMADTGEESAS